MEPTLLIGDRLFVSKYSYGYSRHSFPFSPPIIMERIISKKPKRGDVIVFKTPADNRTDYIKRLIGLPNDIVQIVNGNLFLNNIKVERVKINNTKTVNCGKQKVNVDNYLEILPNGAKYEVVYNKNGTMMNTDEYRVPDNHYFFMGDNRDCSKDSRFLGSVGYVNFDNFVGKAQIIFFSNDTLAGSFLKFWNWDKSLRINRFFSKIF